MKLSAVLATTGLCLAYIPAALACGEAAPPYYVVAEQWPRAEPAPRNAPLVVSLEVGEDGPVYESFSPSLVLTPAGSDRPIALRALGVAPRLAWVPEEPLEANTRYEAHYNSGYEGHPDMIWELTTTDELRPAVSLRGALAVTFEPGTEPILDCRNDCGTDCVERGRREVTRARVRLPRVADGFAVYRGELWLTDETPYDFEDIAEDSAPSTEGHLVALATALTLNGDDETEALVTLPTEDAPYRPCFAFRVTDEHGDRALTEPLCAEETFPFAESSQSSNEGSTTSSACSFSPPSPGPDGAGLLILTASLIRRRRSRSAP